MHNAILKPIGVMAAMLAMSGGALAQSEVLAACRLDPLRVQLHVTFDGSACLDTGSARVSAIRDGIVRVTVPTTETADLCTMNIVPVEFSQSIPVDETVTSVDVTVLGPDNQPFLTGTAAIDGYCTGEAPPPIEDFAPEPTEEPIEEPAAE